MLRTELLLSYLQGMVVTISVISFLVIATVARG